MTTKPSTRAEVITRRTYCRPLDTGGFETWDQVVDRVISHQRWLWARALNQAGKHFGPAQDCELEALRSLMLDRKISVSGRTLWLGGTDVAKRREASQFNCSFTRVETVHDVVDVFWLLLQGCGVGFKPVPGNLNGFMSPVTIEVIQSTRSEKGGREANKETFEDGVWTISVGDSAEAWARSIGKIMAGKYKAHKLVLDFSEIRPAGERLKGYGWISSGYEPLARAYVRIAELMSKRAGKLLTRMDILDIVNWLGTTLSSRRSAEICLFEWDKPEVEEFISAKNNFWVDNPQRSQSNNSILFNRKPTRDELQFIFDRMVASGGSEPGFINGTAAYHRAPYFRGVNPCAEILLHNKGFCNLVEVDLSKFNNEPLRELCEAVYLAARANYRQTCVDLRDGVLQEAWHQGNQYFRLCGVGLTGLVKFQDRQIGGVAQLLREMATSGSTDMATELGTQRPYLVTTIKPSGTLSKIMDTTEGVHKPLGRYIFNNVNFSKHDTTVANLAAAGYRVFDNPLDPEAVLVTFPVDYSGVQFDTVVRNGEELEVNNESAVVQLDRYKFWMDNYVQHNCSVTISYSPDEVPAIIDWLEANWNSYVGVSFIFRNDPSKTAKDLGYLYLPQEVVTKSEYDQYVAGLKPVDLDEVSSLDAPTDTECAGGACPIR